MKKANSRFTAIVLSVLTFSFVSPVFPATAESDTLEEQMINIHFDLSDEQITFDKDDDGNILDITDIQAKPNSSVRLPDRYIHKEDYSFSGWTVDGVRGYPVDSVIQVTDEDITLTPVWSSLDDDVYHNVSYKVETDEGNVELPLQLQNITKKKGAFVSVSLYSFSYSDNSRVQLGWLYDGRQFLGSQYIIMPDHDIELTPDWHKYYKLSYSPGDVDRLNGVTSSVFDRLEKQSTDLAESGRFSRNGFKITGWICDYDGKLYAPLQNYVMPSQDVTFTAVWEPLTYNVVFMGNTGKTEDILRVKGQTDTTIICPELTGTKSGYYFAGWQFDEKVDGVTTSTIYQPGDEFLIKGASPGMGISLSAVWKKGTPPVIDPDIKYGDANCDGIIRLNDAILILQSIGNPAVYGISGSDPTAITAEGVKKADCFNTGDGLTSQDALAVQQYTLGLVTELPVINQ